MKKKKIYKDASNRSVDSFMSIIFYEIRNSLTRDCQFSVQPLKSKDFLKLSYY